MSLHYCLANVHLVVIFPLQFNNKNTKYIGAFLGFHTEPEICGPQIGTAKVPSASGTMKPFYPSASTLTS